MREILLRASMKDYVRKSIPFEEFDFPNSAPFYQYTTSSQ